MHFPSINPSYRNLARVTTPRVTCRRPFKVLRQYPAFCSTLVLPTEIPFTRLDKHCLPNIRGTLPRGPKRRERATFPRHTAMDPAQELHTLGDKTPHLKRGVSTVAVAEEYDRDRINLARAGKQQVLKASESGYT